MNNSTGRSSDDVAHIRQSIRDILTTPLASRVMRREYGSLLPDLIDQALNGATRQRAIAATAMALIRWEPRIKISRIQLYQNGAALTVDLHAVRVDTPQRQNVNLSIQLTGSHT